MPVLVKVPVLFAGPLSIADAGVLIEVPMRDQSSRGVLCVNASGQQQQERKEISEVDFHRAAELASIAWGKLPVMLRARMQNCISSVFIQAKFVTAWVEGSIICVFFQAPIDVVAGVRRHEIRAMSWCTSRLSH